LHFVGHQLQLYYDARTPLYSLMVPVLITHDNFIFNVTKGYETGYKKQKLTRCLQEWLKKQG